MAALKIFGKSEKKQPEKPVPVAVQNSQKAPGAAGGGQIIRPHVTEKATNLAGENQYVFVVQEAAAKKEIESDVEKQYGVTVEQVRIIRVHPKQMRLGRTKGVKKGYKKAIVKIKEGQKIEILPT